MLAAGAFFVYYLNQATKLPEWYSDKSNASRKASSVIDEKYLINAKKILENKVKEAIDKSQKEGSSIVQIQFSETELNDLLVSSVAQRLGSYDFLVAVKGSKTSIRDGRLESGMVINISKIPTYNLGKDIKESIDKVLGTFTFLKNREVYVGVEGKPVIKNGTLHLVDDKKIKLGNLDLSLSMFSDKLGVTEENIEQSIDLNLGKLKVKEIMLLDRGALIKGSE